LNSHILHEVELVCSHLAIMAKGQVLATGPIAELAGGAESALVFDLAYRLSASEESIHGDLIEQISTRASGDLVAHHDNLWQGRMTCDDQGSINQIVDAIRARDGSLLRLQPVRETLEDKFMRLVNAVEGS